MGSAYNLNPFEVLDIDVHAPSDAIKKAFKQEISTPIRTERSRIALAYDMLCSKDPSKYKRIGNCFSVIKKDLFFYVNTGNYNEFRVQMTKQKHLINKKDEEGRTLLYIASRSGFHNICSFLLEEGCNINEVQNTGSTALHAAAYYGHQSIVELLLEYGANQETKNYFGNTPIEESTYEKIKNCIGSYSEDKIIQIYYKLKDKGFADSMIHIQYKEKIIGTKILRNSEYFSGFSKSYLVENWILAWHGTKYQHLQSIMKHGLHPAGTCLSPEYKISTQPGHIALNISLGEFRNWANAIFISPSLFYAADIVYSERIFSNNQRWCVLIEARVKSGSFSKHKQTLLNKRLLLPGEPEELEYRVSVKQDEDFILRAASANDVIVTALVFINLTFLENIEKYYEGENLFANSDVERALFQ